MAKINSTYFYKDKPIFGLDIGFSSLKVMQISEVNNHNSITGYGVCHFDPAAVKDGVIVDLEKIASAAKELFDKHLVGNITSRRVAMAVPATRAFTRNMKLPLEAIKDLSAAVAFEAEQYIPVPITELSLGSEIISQTDKEVEVLVVAIPQKIIDSYYSLAKVLGLDPVVFETSISSAARLFVKTDQSDIPTVLIDFGSISSDITIYDGGLIITGTVPGGGDIFTDRIAEKLSLNHDEASIVKSKYGLDLSKKQMQIKDALEPALTSLIKEVKRMVRYYEERTDTKRKISQVVTMGGGANLPGLSEFLTDTLRLPARMSNPWEHLEFKGLQPPHNVEKSLYVTVAGLALINPKEVFKK